MVIFVVCRDPFATSWRQVGKLGVSLKLVVILTHFGLNHFGPTWANFKIHFGTNDANWWRRSDDGDAGAGVGDE